MNTFVLLIVGIWQMFEIQQECDILFWHMFSRDGLSTLQKDQNDIEIHFSNRILRYV
jgi:hypothetical protein